MWWEEIILHRLWRGRRQEQEQEPSQNENIEAISSKELTATISCNAFVIIITPQTLKFEGYIKKKKVIVLIDYGSTHNFIHYKLAKDLNCFVYPALEFQVMIADGGTINFSRKCNKINLTMGEYVMNSPMIVIPIVPESVLRLKVQCQGIRKYGDGW